MNIPLTTPALLFPAIAILMLGYVNRYVSAAGVIRSFKKDYDTGYVHTQIVGQLRILRTRIGLLRFMMMIGAVALLMACLSMFMIYQEFTDLGGLTFGASLIAMITSTVLSVVETSLSNKSLLIELDDVLNKELKKGHHDEGK